MGVLSEVKERVNHQTAEQTKADNATEHRLLAHYLVCMYWYERERHFFTSVSSACLNRTNIYVSIFVFKKGFNVQLYMCSMHSRILCG